jgi:hypothetical protein
MTGTLTDRVGFARPNRQSPEPRRHAVSLEVMTCMALVVSTLVAAMVVSIGIARADGLATAAPADASVAVAVLMALVLAGWGGLTVVMTRDLPRRR